MKKKFSTAWKSSKSRRKQRKYRYNAPLHIRHKFVSVHLSKELRKSLGIRSIPVRKGDKVRIMRGEFKGIKGTVTKVDLKNLKVYIDSVKRKKVSGREVQVPIDPSNLEITELVRGDKTREKIINRRKKNKEEKT
jgi:large subunit ribosomal protein L24